MKRGYRALIVGLSALLGVVLGPFGVIDASASGLTASAPGVTPKTITIGFITSETGIASSTFLDSALGAQVRIDAQNAAGGVDGRKINLIVKDDQSSPTEDGTAASALLSEGVFGIINFSPFAFGSDTILQQAGVPVTGGAFDGPEWGQQPFTNMFSYGGGLDPHDPASTVDGLFLKSLGATKIGGIAYGISPSSTNSIKDLKESVDAVGLSMPYEDLSFPFGSTDTTVQVLQMKQSGVDAAVCSCVQSTNIALIVNAEQAGLKLKGEFSFSGADSSLFANQTDIQAAQGAYFPTTIVPLDLHTAADNLFVKNLRKYDPHYKGGYPSYGLTGSYLSADLMIKGLELAGRNPTRSAFIHNLSKVSAYNAEGLLPNESSFTHFGHGNKTGCMYVTKVEGTQFVTIHDKKPYCGKAIPNSDVA